MLTSIIGAVALLGGTLVGHRIADRKSRRDATVAHQATESSAQNQLIDQLQEELAEHRRAQGDRMTAQDERMNRLERYSDGYRDHAHQLRSHIWDGKPPPPPPWPDGLPR